MVILFDRGSPGLKMWSRQTVDLALLRLSLPFPYLQLERVGFEILSIIYSSCIAQSILYLHAKKF